MAGTFEDVQWILWTKLHADRLIGRRRFWQIGRRRFWQIGRRRFWQIGRRRCYRALARARGASTGDRLIIPAIAF